jgi:hypothetical protein
MNLSLFLSQEESAQGGKKFPAPIFYIYIEQAYN